jgi:hypothetical protein
MAQWFTSPNDPWATSNASGSAMGVNTPTMMSAGAVATGAPPAGVSAFAPPSGSNQPQTTMPGLSVSQTSTPPTNNDTLPGNVPSASPITPDPALLNQQSIQQLDNSLHQLGDTFSTDMSDDDWEKLGNALNANSMALWTPTINVALSTALQIQGKLPLATANALANSPTLSPVMKLRLAGDLASNKITAQKALAIAYFALQSEQQLGRSPSDDEIATFEADQTQREALAKQIQQSLAVVPQDTSINGINLGGIFNMPNLSAVPNLDVNALLKDSGFALSGPSGSGYSLDTTKITTNASSVVKNHKLSTNPVAQKLAQAGRDVANGNPNSTGKCYNRVAKAMEKVTVNGEALDSKLSGMSAYMAADQLKGDNRFTEVTGTSVMEEGDIIVYGANASGGHPHGHIEIAQGNGKATSDYIGDVNSGKAYSSTRIFRVKPNATA